jgi:hypothetical protein
MEIVDRTEGTMSSTAAPRYGFNPGVAFATTRAFAERRALETTVASTATPGAPRRIVSLIRRLANRS